jgi:hypothetical protein
VDHDPQPPAADSSGREESRQGKRRSRKKRRVRRARESGRPPAWLIASNVLFVLVLVGSVLALGSVHVPVFLTVSVFAMAAAVCALIVSGVPGGRVTIVATILAGLALYTVLQAAPVPLSLLARLSPMTADTWAGVLRPFGIGPPHVAHLSLDPGASWIEALKCWTYLAVFLSAAAFGGRDGLQWGAVVILGSSLVVALVSVGHGAFHATRVFGIYTPTMGGRGWGVGPLVNMNTLASYLNIGLFAGVGLLASSTPPLPRWLLGIAVATVFGVSINTGSRGGLGSMLLGFALLLPLLRSSGKAEGADSKRDRALGFAAVALALTVGVMFAFVAATGRTYHLLSDPSVTKLRMAFWVPPMIRDYPWFGVGRGAFESVFPAYKMGDNNSVFTHPENFVIEWITGWGLPVAVAVLVALAWLFRPSTWRAGRSTVGSGLFVGFASLALQNLADLGLELPGVGIAAFAAAGIALGDRADTSTSPALYPVHPLVSSGIVLLVGLALLFPASLIGARTLHNDKVFVHEAYPKNLRNERERAIFKAHLKEAMRRHPAEAYFPREGALFAMVSRSENAVPWIQRALERATTSGRTHYLLAVLLERYGIWAQSLLEFRYAVERDIDLTTRAARHAVRLTRNHDELLRAVPAGTGGVSMLVTLGEIMRKSDGESAYRFFEEAVERNPEAGAARVALTKLLLESLPDRRLGARCGQERRVACERVIIGHIRTLAKQMPTSEEPLILAARLLLSGGRTVQATNLLAAVCPTLPKHSGCVVLWVETSAQTGDPVSLRRSISYAERDGCSSPAACARTYTMIGDIVSRSSGPFGALPYYRRSVAEEPNRARWLRVASVASMLGAHGEASRALDHAATYGGAGPDLQQRIERERARAMREALKIP